MSRASWVSKQEREEWRKKHRSGLPIAQIAKDAGRDPSTVAKNLRKADEDYERLVARIALYENAIRDHGDRMLGALTRLKERLSFVPPHRVATSSSHPGQGALQPPDLPFELDPSNFHRQELVVEGEHGLEHELVREHLADRVRLWRDYDRWLTDHGLYLWQAWRMGSDASQRFGRLSGLGPVSEGEGFGPSCVDRLCAVAIDLTEDGSMLVTGRLRVDGPGLEVDGTKVVHSAAPKKLTRAVDAFQKVAAELVEHDGAQVVANAIRELPAREKRLRREFDLIAVMGIVGGTCEACKPYIR